MTKKTAATTTRTTAHCKGAFLIGCLTGCITFLLIYGTSILSFTNTSWLMSSDRLEGICDLTQHYMGWVFYRNSPWHFPLGLLDGLYSAPISITYTDSIPLFAIFFKMLSPLLPMQFQYFGLFGLISYILTGGFGALLIHRFIPSHPFCLLSAVFFVVSPVLTKRMFYHTALAAPFLILAAFCLCAYAASMKSVTKISCWSILSAVSVLINPYYIPMVLGIMLCGLLYEFLHKMKMKTLLFSISAPIISFLLAGYISGMFYGSVRASANGLNDLSFNLLQFFNPLNEQLRIINRNYLWTEQNYSRLLPTLPLASPWQVEGFSYLGAGMILILVLVSIKFLYRFIQGACAGSCPVILCISIGFIVFTFLALSPTAVVLDHTLYSITYPAAIYRLLSVFRSTGRLIWPVYYACVALGLAGIGRLFFNLCASGDHKGGYISGSKVFLQILLPGICLLLQLYDLSPSLVQKHDTYAGITDSITYESPLTSKAWEVLGTSCEKIVFYPPAHYGLYCDPFESCTFTAYADRYHLSCNITYLSRNLSAQADADTYSHFSQRKAGASFPENIYIFFDISEVPPASDTGLNYYKIDQRIVGTELDLSGYSGVDAFSPEYPHISKAY